MPALAMLSDTRPPPPRVPSAKTLMVEGRVSSELSRHRRPSSVWHRGGLRGTPDVTLQVAAKEFPKEHVTF